MRQRAEARQRRNFQLFSVVYLNIFSLSCDSRRVRLSRSLFRGDVVCIAQHTMSLGRRIDSSHHSLFSVSLFLLLAASWQRYLIFLYLSSQLIIMITKALWNIWNNCRARLTHSSAKSLHSISRLFNVVSARHMIRITFITLWDSRKEKIDF